MNIYRNCHTEEQSTPKVENKYFYSLQSLKFSVQKILLRQPVFL
jgi:hypothetical protein